MELLLARAMMPFGAMVSGLATFGNDSMQAFGPLLEATKRISRWYPFLFLCALMGMTLFYGWYVNDGDVSYGRLSDIPYPEEIHLVYIWGPLTLLTLTLARIPVSTTFLILFAFSSDRTIEEMIDKSMYGGGVALLTGCVLWFVLKKFFDEHTPLSKHSLKWWRRCLWVMTGLLWTQWLTQDLANVAVFLPRQMTFIETSALFGYLSVVLGAIFLMKGGPLQGIVASKTNIRCPRSASIICLVYALILFGFRYTSTFAMSTTWVFVCLLVGRELGMHLRFAEIKNRNEAYIIKPGPLSWLIPRVPVVRKRAILDAAITALRLGLGLAVSYLLAKYQSFSVFAGALALLIIYAFFTREIFSNRLSIVTLVRSSWRRYVMAKL